MDAASTRNDPRRLWARAATLSELLAGEVVRPRADAAEESPARLAWFCAQLEIPVAGSPRWHRFLERAGWSDAAFRRAAAPAEWIGAKAPPWFEDAEAVLGAADEAEGEADAELLASMFGRVAATEAAAWRSRTSDWTKWIAPTALDEAASALAARLRATSGAMLASVRAAQGGEDFAGWLRDGGWNRALRQRPALLRLLCNHLADWRGAWGEFVVRLRADASALATTLGAMPPVRRVEMSRSDFHARGRSVIEAEFADGVVAFYKPRPVAAEQAVARIHAALEIRVLGPDARREFPALVTRATHGWMAAAETWPAGATLTTREARAQLRRLGVVLGLAHLLKLSDLHGENVLLGPRGPVIVDAETVWHPPERAATLENVRTGEHFPWETSILRTNLIAQRLVFAGKPYGWDGVLPAWFLHAQGPPEPPELARTPRRRPGAPNNSFWDAVAGLGSSRWRDWVTSAYRQTLIFARPRRNALERIGRQLAPLPRRTVQRDTFLYGVVLRRSLEDPHLSDGWHRAAALEMIWLAGGRDEPLRPGERASLEHGDIPLVSAPEHPADDFAEPFWKASAANPSAAARRLHAWLASGVPVIQEWIVT